MNMKLVSNIEKKRLTEIKEFLESENIPLTSLVKIKGDASFRVYYSCLLYTSDAADE